jgi:hypothetical protein
MKSENQLILCVIYHHQNPIEICTFHNSVPLMCKPLKSNGSIHTICFNVLKVCILPIECVCVLKQVLLPISFILFGNLLYKIQPATDGLLLQSSKLSTYL